MTETKRNPSDTRSTAKTAADTITQDAIRAVVDLDFSIQQAVYDLRKRLIRGASVAPGALTVVNDELTPLADSRPKRTDTLVYSGLSIEPKRKTQPARKRSR